VGLNLSFVGRDAVVIPISAEFYSGNDALRDRQIGSSSLKIYARLIEDPSMIRMSGPARGES
jgi:hypothetical protein